MSMIQRWLLILLTRAEPRTQRLVNILGISGLEPAVVLDVQVENHLVGANDWEVPIAPVNPKTRCSTKKNANRKAETAKVEDFWAYWKSPRTSELLR